MDSTCEAFELDYCTAQLTDENEFESKLKAELPSGAKYIVRCAHHEGKGVASYNSLVWLAEAQLVTEVTRWVAKVVVDFGGNHPGDHTVSFPAENQTVNEFLLEKYTAFAHLEIIM
jgi:hypothetical protein